jgi:hypothetical protein
VATLIYKPTGGQKKVSLSLSGRHISETFSVIGNARKISDVYRKICASFELLIQGCYSSPFNVISTQYNSMLPHSTLNTIKLLLLNINQCFTCWLNDPVVKADFNEDMSMVSTIEVSIYQIIEITIIITRLCDQLDIKGYDRSPYHVVVK